MAELEPVSVGLVGAGPWAQLVHAPVLAAGPETRLAGVWTRRTEAAAPIAEAHGVPVFERYEALLDACDAVAFAVAPAAQADLAVAAADAGKALLLEKPIAEDLPAAERLADAVASNMVGSLVVLSYRFTAAVNLFLADLADLQLEGGRIAFVSDAFIGGLFSSSPWRKEHGALLDLGPHALDLIDAALGPIVDVEARRSPGDAVSLLLGHEGGATSTATLSGSVRLEPPRLVVEVFGPTGLAELDAMSAVGATTFETLRAEFALVVRTGAPHELDVHRGLHLQRLLDRAARQLG